MRAVFGDTVGNAAGGGQQEVTRATGGVDERQDQQGLFGVIGALAWVQHGVEGGIEEGLDQ